MSLVILAGALIGMLAVMNAAWAFQRTVGNSGWIDVFWTFGTGAVGFAAALLPFMNEHGPSARQILVAAIVAVWALRLGSYIGHRVATSEEDTRYAHFREVWGEHYQRTLWLFVLPQAAITALLCWSINTAALRRAADLDIRDFLGVAILVVAIGGEALADHQLSRFKRTNRQKGAICDVGLWRWSRHPNYFFEWFGWTAYAVIALDPLHLPTYPTLIAPIVMYLVLRYATGVAPLERTMIASRGDAYRRYQDRVSAFFPLPPKQPSATTGAAT